MKVFGQMESQSKKRYSIPQVTDVNDIMLQFHRAYELEAKDYSTERLLDIMDKCSSRVCLDNNRNPSFYKNSTTPTGDAVSISEILQGVNSGRIKEVTTTYKFAGKVYNISSKVDENSREYKNYLKSKDKQVGGGLSWLDNMVSGIKQLILGLESKRNISAILKSQKDWEQFTKKHQLQDKLKQGHKFIKQSNFISRAEWLEHQIKLDNKPVLDPPK